MLSPGVRWLDVDPEQWANLWRFAFHPDLRPRRVFALTDGGRPAALLDSHAGQLGLELWPDTDDPHAAARVLRERTAADQVVLVDVDVLAELWSAQQRAYRPEQTFDAYLLGCLEQADAVLAERAVREPDTLEPIGFRGIRYRRMLELLAPLTESDGAFVVAVFSHGRLWWTLAGRVADGAIAVLTTSRGLPLGAADVRGCWRDCHSRVVAACEEALGPVGLAVSLPLHSFERVAFAADPRWALCAEAASGRAVLDPWPHPTALRSPRSVAQEPAEDLP